MPRSIWSSAISFGLVNVPVRMYSAVSEHSLHFNYIHEKDASPIGYAKYCKEEGKSVDDSEVARAFDWNGEYVVMADEDFERAQEDGYRTIDIKDFVDVSEIDPVYFERTYHLGPAEGGEKVYALLVRAMEESGRAAIAKYVMRDRQHLGCLRVRDGALALEKMYFHDEIRDAGDVAPDAPRIEKAELDLAKDLIERLAGSFEPEKYHDTYRDTLCEVIREKRETGEVKSAPRPEKPKQAPDLMAALKASLDGGGNGAGGSEALEAFTKAELYERAKKADIPGRADMTKDELVEALA